jgi:hypothetical protein
MIVIVFFGLVLAISATIGILMMTFLSVAFAGPAGSSGHAEKPPTDSLDCTCASHRAVAPDQAVASAGSADARSLSAVVKDLQHTGGGV